MYFPRYFIAYLNNKQRQTIRYSNMKFNLEFYFQRKIHEMRLNSFKKKIAKQFPPNKKSGEENYY